MADSIFTNNQDLTRKGLNPSSGNLEDYLSIVAFENGCIVNRDGSISRGFSLSMPEEEEIDNWDGLIQDLSAAMKSLPEGTTVQKIDFYYPHKEPIEIPSDYSFFHKKTLENHSKRSTLKHEAYLFLKFFTKDWSPITTYLGQNKLWDSIPWDDNLSILNSACRSFVSAVPSVISLSPLDEQQYYHVLGKYLNLIPKRPSNSIERSWFNLPDRVSMGIDLKGVMLRTQAEEVYGQVKNNLGNNGVSSPFLWPVTHFLRFPHIVCQEVEIIDGEAFRKSKNLELDTSSLFRISSRSRELSSYRTQQFMEYEKHFQKNDTRLVNLKLSVFTWGEGDDLDNQVDQLKSGLLKTGLGINEIGHHTADRFLAHAPGGAGFLEGCFMPMETALAHLPFITPRKGDTEGVYLQDRHGTPLFYDPFKYSLDNQHVFLFGPSGSGKSFFNGKMIKDRYEAGHTMVVIDSGGTYRFLFKALKGTYIEYKPDQPLSLNPFLIKPTAGKYIPDTDKVAFLVNFIAKVWKGDLNKDPLKEVEYALLAKSITKYYEALKKDAIPHLKDFCKWLPGHIKDENVESAMFDLKSFLLVLAPFTDGIYKDHFNALKVEHLQDSRLICFELEAVKNDKKLYPLVVQVLFDYILQLVASQPDQKKFIDIEEGWSMLDDASESYIEAFFRKGRKTNTSIRMITQSVSEIQGSKIAGAMKNNAATFILLYNDKASVREDVASFLGMNDFDLEKYASMRRNDIPGDTYREVLIKEMDNSRVWRVSLSPHEHALLTSRPDERNRIQELVKREGNIETGVTKWIAINNN